MVLLESEKIAMGEDAHNFSLPSTDGRIYSLSDFSSAKVLVVVFMCNHCPYVQRIWEDLVRLQDEFLVAGVQLVGINPNFHPDYPEETMEKMREYAQNYDMNFQYLLDETQEIAKTYSAQCTPDIYVYDEGRKLVYHGRIEEDELKGAIRSALHGGDLMENQKPSIGCSIKWRD